MVDFAMDIYKKLHNTDEVPEEMVQRRTQAVERLQKLTEETAPIRDVLDDPALVQHLREEKCFTMGHLVEQRGVPEGALDKLYEWARFQYECGNYEGAAECLHHFRLLTTSPDQAFLAQWGKFGAEILNYRWDVALEDMNKLKDSIEGRAGTTPPLMVLQQRSWLMHWSLYVFFNHPEGRAAMVDLCFQERYLNAMQTNCQHLLRYLIVAVTLTKRKQSVLRELTRVVVQEELNYSDPITRFLSALVHNSDFDAAMRELKACEAVMDADYFLVHRRAEFLLAAKMLVFESYCRIHRRIDITHVASMLDMSVDDAERWVVNLVRDAHLGARIDSQQNRVVISAPTQSAYQKVIETTKGLQFRSLVLANAIEQRSTGE